MLLRCSNLPLSLTDPDSALKAPHTNHIPPRAVRFSFPSRYEELSSAHLLDLSMRGLDAPNTSYTHRSPAPIPARARPWLILEKYNEKR